MEMSMKKLLAVIFITLFSFAFMIAQEKIKVKEKQTKSYSTIGYLVDRMCGEKMVMADIKKSDAKAARHTKECALDDACSAEGYGLVSGGKFYTFDVSGNIKAKEYFKATQKENNIKVEVIGTINEKKLTVESIKDFKSTPKKHDNEN